MEEAKEDDKGKEGDKVVEAGVGDLALELFLHIVGFLEPADLVRVEAVQRAWADALRHDDHTWRTVFRAHLGQGPSRPTTAARGSWRSRCVKAARRAHQTANRADLTPEARALELLKVACACGLHRLCARVLADGCQFRSAETFDYAGSGLYPLHLAVASGSPATVQVLAEAGFNVHQRNSSGVTPIGAAVQTGQLDLVEVLLRHGASSEELSQLTGGGGGGDGRGGAPKGKGKVKRKNTIPILHQAAAAGHTRIVQVLLDLARQGKGTTFHRDDEAAASAANAEGGSKDDKEDGDEGDAKYLNVPDRFGNTPLQLAVEKDREAMVRFLVAKGADVNQVHRVTRLAPLHWAVKHDKLSTARLLLELGAANEPVRSIDQQYLVTVPPFFLACECQLPDMVQLFLEHFGPGIMDAVVPHSSMTSTPLLRVLQLIQCRKEFVEFLLAKGANVRATTGGPHPKDALTCLLQRCKPSAEIVALLEMLIDAIGLPMDHRADLLETTASYSFAKENPAETEEHFKHVRDMFDLLVAKGVQVPRHETNIMVIVAQHGSVDMVRFFLDKGVHIDARHRGLDPTLKSLLGYWRFERDTERTMDLLKFFLENGADPNQRNDRGETACFWVGKQGQALELLVKHGADVNVTNEEGCTPLTKLLYQLHELNFRYLSTQTTFDELADIARLFVRLGADPKLGGDPYRRILHEVVSRPTFAPEWLALVAELGVPIDTESPLPDSDHEEDEAPELEETTS